MKKIMASLALVTTFSGCATYHAQQSATIEEIRRTTPTCSTDQECALKWSAARRWVLNNASRKLQHVTDDFMETYNPEPYSPSIAARVTKEPLPDGRHQIVVAVWCANIFGCQPDKFQAALSFNRTVNAAAPSTSSPQPTTPSAAPTTSAFRPGTNDDDEAGRAGVALINAGCSPSTVPRKFKQDNRMSHYEAKCADGRLFQAVCADGVCTPLK